MLPGCLIPSLLSSFLSPYQVEWASHSVTQGLVTNALLSSIRNVMRVTLMRMSWLISVGCRAGPGRPGQHTLSFLKS